MPSCSGKQDILFAMNFCYWTSSGDTLSKLGMPVEGKIWCFVEICILQMCYHPEFFSLLVLKFPICPVLICIVRCTFINFYVHPDEKFCVCTSPVSIFTAILWLSAI